MNKEQLALDIAKAGAFGIKIRNNNKTTIILTSAATASRSTSEDTEIREALRKIKAACKYDQAHDNVLIKK